MHDAVDLYQPLAEDKNQKIIVASKAMQYKGDRDLIFQVITNLLDNAIKFMQENGQVHIILEGDKNNKKIIVEDNGPGISEKCIDKVFDRFYRAKEQQIIEGSGLGLKFG